MTNNLKQIWFEEDTGKLKLFRSDNVNYNCNLYGDKLSEFLPNVSGVIGFNNRKDITDKDDFSKIIPKLMFNNENYLPQKRNFEGYFQFPRPLSQPFFNEKKLNKKYKEKLYEAMRGQFKVDKNLHLLDVQDNQGLNYFTSSLKFTDKESKKKLIKAIDKFIEDFKEENKYKPDMVNKDSQVKALRLLKYKLSINDGTSQINGRKLASPSKEVKKLFHSVEKSIKGGKKKEEISEQINFLINSTLNKDELSFMSVESDSDKYYADRELKPFKGGKELVAKCSKEKNNLKGFQIPVPKEEGIIIKELPKSLKTPGELYYENKRLFEKVNPIAVKLEKERNDFDKKILEKRRKQKMVNQANLGF